jgi:TM2 domain-containing membrane protein YozV
VIVTESKNPGVAALLAFFVGIGLFGIGHIYVGRIGRGLVLLVISVGIRILLFLGLVALPLSVLVRASAFGGWFMLVVVLGLVNLALWVWQTYDAYRLAKQFNAHVQQYGKAPW